MPVNPTPPLRNYLVRQLIFFAVMALLLILGFVDQMISLSGVNNLFSRMGAVVVGLCIAGDILEKELGLLGSGKVDLFWGEPDPAAARRFRISNALLVVIATLVWGFGDLWPVSLIL